jgi:hypothetical protein
VKEAGDIDGILSRKPGTYHFTNISKKICMFSKNTGYLSRKILKHDNKYYKQALVVAQYQFLIRCYSAMFRNEI